METISDMQTVKPASHAPGAAPPESPNGDEEEEERSAHMRPILGSTTSYVNLNHLTIIKQDFMLDYPGLEALPLPAGIAPIEPPARPISRFNPNMSFDDILREVPKKEKGKKH